MPITWPSSVLSTIRTSSIHAPSPGRIACQSLPPGKSVPRRRSPSKRPPVVAPTRRSMPGVLPTLIAGCTSSSIMNSGRTRSSVISFGRISDSERVVVTSILLAVLRPRAGRRLIDYILKRIEAHLSAIDVNIDRLQLGSCANGKAAEGGAKSRVRSERPGRSSGVAGSLLFHRDPQRVAGVFAGDHPQQTEQFYPEGGGLMHLRRRW